MVPMAAMLVELFPARVRYTSMSLPYHIGNGWFGGLLPTIAFAIVASTGNIYAGIWYPVIIAGITFVVALFFLPETYKRNIHHEEADDREAASLTKLGRLVCSLPIPGPRAGSGRHRSIASTPERHLGTEKLIALGERTMPTRC